MEHRRFEPYTFSAKKAEIAQGGLEISVRRNVNVVFRVVLTIKKSPENVDGLAIVEIWNT